MKKHSIISSVIAWVALCVFCVLTPSCIKDEIVADIVMKKKGTIHLEAEGVGISDLYNEYKVVVYNEDGQKVTTIFFNGKTNIINYRAYRLRSGKCYTFEIERQDLKNNFSVKWVEKKNRDVPNRLCIGTKQAFESGQLTKEDSKPVIVRVIKGLYNADKGHWDEVTVVVRNDHEDLTFSLNGSTPQYSNVFTGLKEGKYTVKVKDKYGQTASIGFQLGQGSASSVPSTVATPKPVASAKPATATPATSSKPAASGSKTSAPTSTSTPAIPKTKGRLDVQAIIDQVSRGELYPADAQKILAAGEVKLKEKIMPDDIKTLWGVLEEAGLGEFFLVKDYDLTPKDKVVSGSLLIYRR